jgi:hypothetical protein
LVDKEPLLEKVDGMNLFHTRGVDDSPGKQKESSPRFTELERCTRKLLEYAALAVAFKNLFSAGVNAISMKLCAGVFKPGNCLRGSACGWID